MEAFIPEESTREERPRRNSGQEFGWPVELRRRRGRGAAGLDQRLSVEVTDATNQVREGTGRCGLGRRWHLRVQREGIGETRSEVQSLSFELICVVQFL